LLLPVSQWPRKAATAAGDGLAPSADATQFMQQVLRINVSQGVTIGAGFDVDISIRVQHQHSHFPHLHADPTCITLNIPAHGGDMGCPTGRVECFKRGILRVDGFPRFSRLPPCFPIFPKFSDVPLSFHHAPHNSLFPSSSHHVATLIPTTAHAPCSLPPAPATGLHTDCVDRALA